MEHRTDSKKEPGFPSQTDPVLSLRDLSKSFHVNKREIRGLQNVSFEVSTGEIAGLIGPDGAGKTTLMRCCAGLLTPDRGAIDVSGISAVTDSLKVQASVGYMPQRFGLYEDLSVLENLNLYADLQGVPKEERDGRYEELMHMTGLGPFLSRLAGRLSGGMKQKLGLACTLVHPPRLLILDEPTVGVDPVSRRELWSIVSRLVKEERMTVLLSTAYLDEAEQCHKVIILHEGKVLGQGPPRDFSREMENRVYTVNVSGKRKREMQEKLSEQPDVLDAVIQGESLRIVLSKTGSPRDISTEFAKADFKKQTPRFEDCYVVRLQEKKQEKPKTTGEFQKRDKDKEVEAISVDNLSRKFGDFYAVKQISFQVRQGEVFGLLGANGAGKSTTFRMLCGLLPASSGTLQVAGNNLRHAPARARSRIGYMSQKFSLYATLSVQENMYFFSKVYNLKGNARRQRIDWGLKSFDLQERRDVISDTLPLGYKQRLALACALMHEPDILFLDEPTSGVDPLARREFWHHINALSRAGVTVMVTTHFLEESEYCDRVAIMASGEVLTVGTPAAIKKRTEAPDMEEAFIRLIQNQEGEEA